MLLPATLQSDSPTHEFTDNRGCYRTDSCGPDGG